MHCLPRSIEESHWYPHIVRLLRILQVIFAAINIGLFVAYIVRAAAQISHSSGAVTGLLSAALLFGLIGSLLSFLRLGEKKSVKTFLLIGDVMFVAAFIYITVVTSKDRSRSGNGTICPHKGLTSTNGAVFGGPKCGLTPASMAFAILSALTHASSGIFQRRSHKDKDIHRHTRYDKEAQRYPHNDEQVMRQSHEDPNLMKMRAEHNERI